MKRKRNAIAAVVGDLHTNSTVGLAAKSFTLDDGGTRAASPVQRFIHDAWVDYWDKVWKQKKKRGWPLYVIFNGELADDNYHSTTQLITKNPADQLRHAMKVIERPIDMADYVFVIRGTEAHVGPSAWMDEKIAQDIKGTVGPPELGGEIKSWFHWRGAIGGVRFDITHHPGTGHRVPWTKGGDANRLAAALIYRYVEYNSYMEKQGTPEYKQEMPHIAIRGHNHRPSDSGNNHVIRGIIQPSWQLTNSFGHRLGGDWLPIGSNYFLCRNGEVGIRQHYKMWPVADYWRAELDYEEALE